MLVAVSLLAVALSVLIYRHPPTTWSLSYTRADRSTPKAGSEAAEDGKEQSTATEEPPEEPEEQTRTQSSNPLIARLSPQTTPKAAPSEGTNGSAIPTFTLVEHESSDEEEADNLPPPSFPAINSAQRASAQSTFETRGTASKPTPMLPPPKPASLMAPPPRINPSNLRALPTPSQSIKVPSTGPLPNRGPVPNRGSVISNGGLVPTVKTPNARGKVLLAPGHSPLDWANLQRSGKNLSGVSSLIRVTPSMLKEKNGRKGKPAWSSYEGKVYNITPYLPFHPGGEGELRRAAGKDGGKLFMEVHPWVNWDNMLGECLVGIMVAEEQAQTSSSLEDMD